MPTRNDVIDVMMYKAVTKHIDANRKWNRVMQTLGQLYQVYYCKSEYIKDRPSKEVMLEKLEDLMTAYDKWLD